MKIESRQLRLTFNEKTSRIIKIDNLLTGETYLVEDDKFRVEADEFILESDDCALDLAECGNDGVLRAQYRSGDLTVDVVYKVTDHFIQKFISLKYNQDYKLRKVIISQPRFAADNLTVIVPYRYQHNTSYFGRTLSGGFFAGVELPFDTSLLDGNQVVLSYRPGLKVKAGERVECEPAYLGIYKLKAGEQTVNGELEHGSYHHLPLRSETEAMVAMASVVLGPPRHGPTSVFATLTAGVVKLGETDEKWFGSDDIKTRIQESYDFAAECGIQYVHDFMPWGGEIKVISGLNGEKKTKSNTWLRDLVGYQKKLGLKPIIWSTMTNLQPWAKDGPAFRPDKPEWLVKRIAQRPEVTGNCMGAEEFRQWLTDFTINRMEQYNYEGFSIDGDFTGGGGWYTTSSVPLRCLSDKHSHVQSEAQYACERAVARYLAAVRARFPDAFLWLMRPMMDLGIWTYRNGDAIFTIDECATVENMTGIPGQPMNVTYGDKIRVWARLRRDRQFCPHYLDQAYLFANITGGGDCLAPWDGEKLDYAMLSAISTSPNQCFFSGPVDAIPKRDRAMICKWLDWSRKNTAYLMVRKDLPDYPAAEKTDGSAHVINDRGFVFLFNPNNKSMTARFTLSEEDIGLKPGGRFTVARHYPASDRQQQFAYNDEVAWEIPAFTAVILKICPAI